MRIAGIDYGDKRIGVSFSDVMGLLAGESFTINVTNPEKAFDELCESIISRKAEEIVREKMDYMDVSPKQLVSVAAALILQNYLDFKNNRSY